jgi:hypothetical protein
MSNSLILIYKKFKKWIKLIDNSIKIDRFSIFAYFSLINEFYILDIFEII